MTNAHLLARLDQKQAEVDEVRRELDALKSQLDNPPPGWYRFGWHMLFGATPLLEFWGQTPEGHPIWEKPVLPT